MTISRTFPRIARPWQSLLFLVLAACAWAGGAWAVEPGGEAIARGSRSISVPFIANEGQTDEGIAFYAHTFGGTVLVTRAGEIVYSLPAAAQGPAGPAGVALRETLVGRRASAVRGEGRAVTRVSEFRGREPSRWRSGLPAWDAVDLGEVYDGIDLRLQARGDNVEKIFRVMPGASPDAIGVRVDGGRGLRVTERGELEVATALGPVSFTKPVAFQEIDGRRVDVAARYALRGDGGYGFEVGAYDARHPLVIDPLLGSTFVGGGKLDRAYAIALERIALAGPPDVFIAGWTTSKRLPVAWDEMYDAKRTGPEDAFVAKLDGDLTTLLAATFLGGTGIEEAWGVAVDETGHVYVTGFTTSRDFPATAGAAHESYRGGATDAFVVKLDSDLATLEASTYLGGPGEDRAQAIAFHRLGIYVTGYTHAIETIGAPDGVARGGSGGQLDVFVARLEEDLGSAEAVQLGGLRDDRAFAIAVGGADLSTGGTDLPLVAITGCTAHPGGNVTSDAFFPTSLNAYDASHSHDREDAFVTVLSWDLAGLRGSTFLGGGGVNRPGTCGRAVAIDPTNAVYVAGRTFAPDFPTTPLAYDETYNDERVKGDARCRLTLDQRPQAEGAGDAFVVKLTGLQGEPYDLTTLAASTLLGGCAADSAMALGLDASGRVFVAGYTYSSDFPATVGAYDTTHAGRADAFVARLDGDLTTLSASTFLGGSRFDAAVGLALDGSGNVYVAGYTYSAGFPATDPLADMAGAGDAFVSKLDGSLAAIGID